MPMFAPALRRLRFAVTSGLWLALLWLPFRAHAQVDTPAQAAAGSPTAPAQNEAHPGPQVVQYGSFNAPSAVLNFQNQWSALLPVSSERDTDTLIEDVSNPVWLQANADRFLTTGQYTLTVLSFYKTQRRCRADQIATGNSDSAHVDACNDIRYRVRQIAVDAAQSVVTVTSAAMVWSDGTLDANSLREDTRSRGLRELDPEAQAAIAKATAIIAHQAESYSIRHSNQP